MTSYRGQTQKIPGGDIQEVDPPSPTRLLFQGSTSHSHPQAPGQEAGGRGVEQREQGSLGRLGWGHKGSWGGRGEGWTSVPGLMAQRSATAREAQGVLGARGWWAISGSSRWQETTKGLGVVGGVADTCQQASSAPTIPLLTGPKRANQKLLQGRRLRAPLQAGQDRGLGSSHSLQDPQLTASRLWCAQHHLAGPGAVERPFTINAPTPGPCLTCLIAPFPLPALSESLSK